MFCPTAKQMAKQNKEKCMRAYVYMHPGFRLHYVKPRGESNLCEARALREQDKQALPAASLQRRCGVLSGAPRSLGRVVSTTVPRFAL